jgi:hypothetical protein
MKLHVVVPTIMTNPQQEFSCLDQLIDHFDKVNLDFKIYFVANFPIQEFDEYVPTDKRIVKSVSNLPFSISRAINSIFEKITYSDDDILSFVQSDSFFDNPNWITSLIDVVNDPDLSTGVVGVRPHVNSNQIGAPIMFADKFEIYPALWSDGVMLFKGKVYREVGGFDEKYFGDCESQDFCYMALTLGYTNYWCSDGGNYFGYYNKSASFENKARVNKNEFLQKTEASRQYLTEKWNINL